MAEPKITQAELLPGLMFAQATIKSGDTVSNTTTETDFATNYPVDANILAPGAIIEIKGAGWYSAPLVNAGTSILRIKFGNTVLCVSPSMTNLLGASAAGFTFEAMLTVLETGELGKIQAHCDFTFMTALGSAATVVATSPTPTVVDTTQAKSFKASIKFSVADSNLKAQLTQFRVRIEGPAKLVS